METAANGTDARVETALMRAAAALRDALVAQEMGKFKAPTGELGSLIPEAPQVMRGGAESYVEVYPTGSYMGIKGKTARRAEEVGFVMEYGHGSVPPNPWNARAAKKAKKTLNSIIEQEMRMG